MGTIEGAVEGINKGTDPQRWAESFKDLSLRIFRAAFIEQLKENECEHTIVDRILGTELAARDQKMIDDLVQPMWLALQEQYVVFKQASPREQNRMLAAIVFENLTTGLLTKGVKLTAVKAGKAAARLATGLSEARTTTTVATTAEGLKFPVRVADDALIAQEASLPSTTLCAMEKQAQKAGAKVEGAAAKAEKTIIKVNNIKEFFTQTKFGQFLQNKCTATKYTYQGQKIFHTTEKIAGIMDKNDYFYLDALHKDHIEIFSSNGTFKKVINLDGTLNEPKTVAGNGRSISLK